MVESLKQSPEDLNDNLTEKPDDIKLTVKEAAKYINESPGVIRNWMRELKTHIPTEQGENGYNYFDKKAIETLLLIQQLSRHQNYSLKQIERYLATGGESLKPEKTLEASDEILKDLAAIKKQLELQNEFNKVLVTKLEQQQEYISNSLNERDKQLMIAMRESQQAKQTAVKTKEKGFLGKLFKKGGN